MLDRPVVATIDDEEVQGWRSNGGPGRAHPWRSMPFSLEVPLAGHSSDIRRVDLIGVFGLWAGREYEAPATLGASLEVVGSHGTRRWDLINGRHYADSQELDRTAKSLGDGSVHEPIGRVTIEGTEHRLDRLSVELDDAIGPAAVRFRDLGSPASFCVFRVVTHAVQAAVCPFRGLGDRVSLADLAAAIRVGDRSRVLAAVQQLEAGVSHAEDLDEARGQCLTFLAMALAGTLEAGGGRAQHRFLLDSARALDETSDAREMVARVRGWVEEVASLILEVDTRADRLIERALAIVERNYAKPLSDESVAEQLGISTSHFRYLFKKATGKPFHKYLVGLRLERARELLVDHGLSVSDAASTVGFAGLAHFSRAFSQRFNVNPSAVRESAR